MRFFPDFDVIRLRQTVPAIKMALLDEEKRIHIGQRTRANSRSWLKMAMQVETLVDEDGLSGEIKTGKTIISFHGRSDKSD